jgi:membrane protein
MSMALLKNTWRAFNEDKALRLASAIAYATIFSLVPLIIVMVAVAGWVLVIAHAGQGSTIAENTLIDGIRRGAGDNAAQAVRQLVASSFDKPRQSIIAQAIGWVTFFVGASGLFGALQDALNTVWGVEAVRGGWRYVLRSRIASFGMVAVVGFLLLVSLLLNALVTAIAAHFSQLVPFGGGAALLNVASWIVSLALVTLVFALVYKVLPDVRLAWRDVWGGAAVTAVLFVVGQALISLYLTVAGVASAYGAAGSVLVTLIWIYYSSVILLLGAEFTKVRAGTVRTTVPAGIRQTKWQPVGVDPRQTA